MATAPNPRPENGQATASEPRRLSSEDRRRQILDNAVELFSQHGFSGTRTKDIAAASGVSEGILFRHFNTKEDLYHAILDNYEAGSNDWMAEMKRLADLRDDEGFVRCMTAQILKSFREDKAFHRLMAYARLEGHSMVDIFHERMGLPTVDFICSYIARRQADGAFRPGNPMALGIFVFSPALQFALNNYVYEHPVLPLSEQEAVEQITQFALGGLRVTNPPASEPTVTGE